MVQFNVWRAVRWNGNDDEHNDFKIRTEERRWEKMKQELEKQATIIAKLKAAHVALKNEKEDVKAMHDHDQNKLEEGAAPDRAAFDNPLQK